MNKPLSIAFGLSAALHVVLAAAVYFLISRAIEPMIADKILVLNIEAPSADAEMHGGSDVETEIESTTPARARAPLEVPDEPPKPPAPVQSKPEPVSAAPVATASTQQGVVAVEPVEQSAAPLASSTALTTSGDSERALAEVPAEPQAPASDKMSAQDTAMLEQRLQAWTRDDDSLPDLSDGDTWTHDGKTYSARFTALPAGDDTSLDYIEIEISSEDEGLRRVAGMRLKRMAFSNYTQFVHRWDPRVQIHDDVLDGRFHANSKINIAYDSRVSPKFHGKVTTAARRVDYMALRAIHGTKASSTRMIGRVRRNEIFAGGLETNVEKIPMPERFVPFPHGSFVPEERIKRLTDETHIAFYPDGTYSLISEADGSGEWIALTDETHYILGAPKKTLHVKGVVDGRVLIYSPHRIDIAGSLTYANDPRVNPDSDDFLGLVADKSVEVARPSVTGPGDLWIFAAVYAKRRFAINRYMSRGENLLYLYGSLSAGSLSATEPRYRTQIVFDPRLAHLRPPAFPLTDRFELDCQDSAWSVQPTVAAE